MELREEHFQAMLNQMYKDEDRIKELEYVIKNLIGSIHGSPYGWCIIDVVEQSQKILNKEY